jgi:hypothetical protein
MPLADLPTELDAMIISYLDDDRQASNRLSRVSHYYRYLAESSLYKNIALDVNDHIGLLLLSRTLINRPILALYIKSIRFTHLKYPSLAPVEEVSLADLYSIVGPRFNRKAREQVNRIVKREPASSARKELICGLRATHINSYTALAVCMAVKLEHLELCRARTPLNQVLEHPWHITETQPLARLKILDYCTCIKNVLLPPVIRPSIERLTVHMPNQPGCGWVMYAPTTIDAPMLGSFIPILRTLCFHQVHMNPYSLGQLIISPWLTNLRHLEVVQCVCSPYDTWWNMPALLRSLEISVPKLQTFEWWTYSRTPHAVSPFDTFTSFQKLISLTIAYQLLIHRMMFSDFIHSSPRAFFPQGLESLIIHNIPISFINRVVRLLYLHIGHTDDKEAAIVDFITSVAAKASQLRYLKLFVTMERLDANEPDQTKLLEFSRLTNTILRATAEKLSKLGIHLTVFGTFGIYECNFKVLVRAGYTAPLPQSLRFES